MTDQTKTVDVSYERSSTEELDSDLDETSPSPPSPPFRAKSNRQHIEPPQEKKPTLCVKWGIAIIALILGVILGKFALALPGISLQTPVNNTALQGNASELFLMTSSNETLTGGSVYIDGLETTLNCTGQTCTTYQNFLFVSDNSTHSFFFILNSLIMPGMNTFIIDRIPVVPTNFSAIGVTETSIRLSWNPNPEIDIQHYRIMKEGIFLANTTSLTYLDTGLPTGTQQNYTLEAIDGRDQQSSATNASAIPQDMTPPILVNLTPTTGNLYPSNPIQFTAIYNENVTLQALTGGFPLVQQGLDENHTIAINFGANGTFYLTLNATDAAGNSLLIQYIIMVGPNTTSINLTVLGITGISDVCYPVKTNAFPTGSDWWIMRCDLVNTGLDNLTVRFDDMVGALDTIDFTSEGAPIAFCFADYDSVTQDIIASPIYTVINVTNTFGMAVFNCPDTNPSSATTYSIMWKIPVPAGQVPDTYAMAYQWAYDLI